jgi:hypothetical protein
VNFVVNFVRAIEKSALDEVLDIVQDEVHDEAGDELTWKCSSAVFGIRNSDFFRISVVEFRISKPHHPFFLTQLDRPPVPPDFRDLQNTFDFSEFQRNCLDYEKNPSSRSSRGGERLCARGV